MLQQFGKVYVGLPTTSITSQVLSWSFFSSLAGRLPLCASMAKKSKEPKPVIDQVLSWISILAGLIALVCLVPKVPYRYAEIYTGYHARFGVQRRYSLFGLTNRNGQLESWFKVKRDTCMKMKEYAQSNPLLAVAGSLAASQSKVGGAVAGCVFWDACKAQLNVRCMEYTTMSIISLICMLFQLIGAGCLLCVPMMLNSEDDAAKDKKGADKKEKATRNAMQATMNVTIAGFMFPLISWAMYMGMTDSMFHTFKAKEAYAYGYAYVGSYIAVSAFSFASLGVLCAWRRWAKFGQDKDDEEDTAAANASLPTDPMAGMPPGGAPGMPPPMPPPS
ncbi:hypothetical protein AK812_SmicGene19100 [Symbiodinium microadriaticum]|uniref:Uncharacterized protein n=1 Tax=Symbiodinium microadriaticum TaxID=2951 RepID=A0A1Q9DTJ7_SYMMI|nr:hypothetical protein AK812_SmicGene19100 [Symbiodinium microadriaticum]CAE7196788.1 unnamed protein product [Symbiodinium sp. KB8]CAE7215172.1 unnamed protein product [Symbiodinium microadriaticum]